MNYVFVIPGAMLTMTKATDALHVWPDGHYAVVHADASVGMYGDAERYPVHYDYSVGMHEAVSRGALTEADITKFKQAISRFVSSNMGNRAGDPVRISQADAITIGNIGQQVI